jgi:hypothetical protein
VIWVVSASDPSELESSLRLSLSRCLTAVLTPPCCADLLADEMIKVGKENQLLVHKLSQFPAMQNKLKSTLEQQNVLLELLGEKEEEIDLLSEKLGK